MNEAYVSAFNRWMDDFTNDPEAFHSMTATALRHVREQNEGKELTYGQEAAATFEVYLQAT